MTSFVSLLLPLLVHFSEKPFFSEAFVVPFGRRRPSRSCYPNIIMPPNQGLLLRTFSPALLPDDLANNNNHPSYDDEDKRIRCAVLGTGMMGQGMKQKRQPLSGPLLCSFRLSLYAEHVSYIMGYSNDIRIDYLCDPHEPSLEKCLQVMHEFEKKTNSQGNSKNTSSTTTFLPQLVRNEQELLQQAANIDLLVIASPNYLHTDTLLRWGRFDLTILLEKPVAVSHEQHQRLHQAWTQSSSSSSSEPFRARVWVAMEYRFIPAIAKLLELIPSTVGELKMCTIRENRFPFLHKIEAWNRDRTKTGDSLVEKWYGCSVCMRGESMCVLLRRMLLGDAKSCAHSRVLRYFPLWDSCHFFDLMRLITGQEADLEHVRALVQRGLNYDDEPDLYDVPIIDSAYVFSTFHSKPTEDAASSLSSDGEESSVSSTTSKKKKKTAGTIACLELCMYADGSRHQEEIIVTGTKGRLEAYLPENKVYAYTRPSAEDWADRSVPPPAKYEQIHDCSNVRDVHGLGNSSIPTHGGYHYSSTAVEWYKLLAAMREYDQTGVWAPAVSLQDGLAAVEIGLRATEAIVNETN